MALWRNHARVWTPMAALAAAGSATWVSIQRIRPGMTWWDLLTTAFQLCFAAGTVAAIAALAGRRLVRRETPGIGLEQMVQRSAICALWLPPTLILVHRGSPWALGPAALLAFSAERLFARPRLGSAAAGSQMAHSVLLAVLAQAAVLAALAERTGIACALLGIWIVLLLDRVRRPLRKPPELRRSLTPSRRVLAMVAAAALLTVSGLTQFLRGGFGFGEGSFLAGLFGGGGGLQRKGAEGRNARRFTSDDLSPSHKAIILWPEQRPGVIGLIPPLPQMSRALSGRTRDENLVIPFFGVYWLLREPDKSPPAGAITMRGNPAYQSFRSNDSVPLTMEAHQNLGVMVSVNCCSAIEVAILNTDTYSRTIQMELLLRNTALPEKPSVSLGVMPVRSESRFRWRGPGVIAPGIVTEETLTFPVPRELELKQFDELWVRFEVSRLRADRSPRISIERFRLVPRQG